MLPYMNTVKSRRIFLTTRWEKRNWFNMIERLEKSDVAVNLQRFTKERKQGLNCSTTRKRYSKKRPIWLRLRSLCIRDLNRMLPYMNTVKSRRIFLTTRWEKRNWFNMIERLEKSDVAVNLQRFTKERKQGLN